MKKLSLIFIGTILFGGMSFASPFQTKEKQVAVKDQKADNKDKKVDGKDKKATAEEKKAANIFMSY